MDYSVFISQFIHYGRRLEQAFRHLRHELGLLLSDMRMTM